MMTDSNMGWRAILLAAAGIVLLAAGAVFAWKKLPNRTGRTEETRAAQSAGRELPLVGFVFQGKLVNLMTGHLQDAPAEAGREDLTVVPEDHQLEAVVDPKGSRIQAVRYEIRDLTGERLLERTRVTESEETEAGFGEDGKAEKAVAFRLPIQNLLDDDVIYRMHLTLETEDRELHYYTRLVYASSDQAEGMLALAEEFSQKTFDPSAAKDLTTYLEVDPLADNSSLGHITLKNSYDMLTWHSLGMQRPQKTILHLREMKGRMAVVELDYTAWRDADAGREYFDVQESFTMRTGPERIYMMYYDRKVNQVFSGKSMMQAGKTLFGISDGEQLQQVSAPGGEAQAVADHGVLWVKDAKSGAVTDVWSQRETESEAGVGSDMAAVRILSVEDDGTTEFAASGYRCRGDHAGETGLSLYRYEPSKNQLTEQLWMPVSADPYDLRQGLLALSALDDKGEVLTTCIGDKAVRIRLEKRETEVVAEPLGQRMLAVSGDHGILAWQDQPEEQADRIHLLDTRTGKTGDIRAEDGAIIGIVGFVGRDLVYSLGHSSDIVTADGRITEIPRYAVEIVDETGERMTRYEKENIFANRVWISDNRVHLSLARAGGSGLEPAGEDTLICNKAMEDAAVSGIGTQNDRSLGRVYYAENGLAAAPGSDREPAERRLQTAAADAPEQPAAGAAWMAYSAGHAAGRYERFAEAVQAVWDSMGVVTDSYGRIIWARADRPDRADAYNQLSDARAYLEAFVRGERQTEDGVLLLDGRGLSLQQVLSVVAGGIPVAVSGGSGPVMITGYDPFNVTLVRDTSGGAEELMGQEDAASAFDAAGDDFLCFVRP